MLNCELKQGEVTHDIWVSCIIEAEDALPYLNVLKTTATQVMKDLADADDMAAATRHFDFAVQIRDVIHRLNNLNTQRGVDK